MTRRPRRAKKGVRASPPLRPPPLLLFALGLLSGLLVRPGGLAASLLLAFLPFARRVRPMLAGALTGVLLAWTTPDPPRPAWAPDPLPPPGLYGVQARVLGATPPGSRGAEARLRTESVLGHPLALDLRLRLEPGHAWRPRPGQRVRLVARLRPPRRPTNPGPSGGPRGAMARRTTLEGWLAVGQPVERLADPPPGRAWLSDVRAAAARRLDDVLAPSDSALARALVLGDRTHVDGAVRDRFANTGQSHLLAVSGLHVGLLLAAVLLLARWASVGLRVRWCLGILTVAVYVPIAGAPPSAVRAGVGVALYLLGRLLDRVPSPFTLLAAVVTVVLVLDPRTVHEGGFRLSLAAVTGILLLTPRLQAALIPNDVALAGIARRPRAPLRRLLAVSLGAWLGVAPLLVLAFGRVTLLAPLLSLVTVPLATWLVATAFLTLALGWITPLAGVLAGAFAAAHTCLDGALRWVLGTGLGACPAHAPGPTWVVTYAVALLAAGLAPTGWARAGGLLLIALVLTSCVLPLHGTPPHVRVTLLDVGHGQAAVLELPDGRTALLDGGRLGDAEPGRRTIAPALTALGIRRLDLATASHEDSDHVSGIPAVHGRIPIERLVVPPSFPATTCEGWRRAGLDVRTAAEGRILLAGPWGRLEVLHPTRAFAAGASSNDRSLVLRLEVTGSGVMLFPADVGAEAIRHLLAHGHELAADVLVLPHHGLPAPATDVLRQAVAARTEVASCGRGARATLPTGTWSTAEHGALTVVFPPGGPRVSAPYAVHDRARYDPPDAMPPLPAPPTVTPWLAPTLLLLFALVAVRPLGWLTAGGAAAAWVLGTATSLAFSGTGLAALFAPFVVATLLGKLPGAEREGARRWVQVVANGATPLVGGLLALAGRPEIGAAVFLGGLSALGADTCATEIGVRFGGTPRHALTGRALRRGESGGVTLLGLLASILGALLAPAAWAAFTPFGLRGVLLVTFAGTAAAFVDSLLGATLQYRGTDEATGRVTEARRTASGRTRRVAGLAWLDNDGVNLVAGIVGAVLAWGLLGWIR